MKTRYTWRHNNVLLAIARAVEERITEANAKAKPKEVKQLAPLQSAFVRAGQALDSKKKVTKKEAPHLLQAANDWKCDLTWLARTNDCKGASCLIFWFSFSISLCIRSCTASQYPRGHYYDAVYSGLLDGQTYSGFYPWTTS